MCFYRPYKIGKNNTYSQKGRSIWQKEPENSAYIGTVLMDLSEAYDCFPNKLITAKFETYGFDIIGFKLFDIYLSDQIWRLKIVSAINKWVDVLTGNRQSSVYSSVILNVFIYHIAVFIEKTDICNFADDVIYTKL